MKMNARLSWLRKQYDTWFKNIPRAFVKPGQKFISICSDSETLATYDFKKNKIIYFNRDADHTC